MAEVRIGQQAFQLLMDRGLLGIRERYMVARNCIQRHRVVIRERLYIVERISYESDRFA
jgi:hypothetical protein